MAKDVKAVPAIATELLNADDRALAELNDLVDSSSKSKPSLDVDAVRARAAELTRALRYFRAEAVRDWLDRTYLESLDISNSESNTVNPVSMGTEDVCVSAATLKDVQDDLGSLYTEIDDVMTMLVSQEHGNAIESALRGIQRARREENQNVTEQVSNGKQTGH